MFLYRASSTGAKLRAIKLVKHVGAACTSPRCPVRVGSGRVRQGPRHEQFISFLEAGLILTEYILDQIQGVDAPDIVARRPFVMRDYPCAARLRRSGAAVGAAPRDTAGERIMFFLFQF